MGGLSHIIRVCTCVHNGSEWRVTICQPAAHEAVIGGEQDCVEAGDMSERAAQRAQARVSRTRIARGRLQRAVQAAAGGRGGDGRVVTCVWSRE